MKHTYLKPIIPETNLLPSIKTSTSNIFELSQDDLLQKLTGFGVEEKKAKMRTKQVWSWLYNQGSKSFDDMTTISKSLRQLLKTELSIKRPKLIDKQVSNDGTRKYLLEIDNKQQIETVYIPDKNRGTLCISSQVGCTLNCSFCHTGTQKLVRNLSAGEIVGQLLFARDDLEDWPNRSTNPNKFRLITNLVLMGMGEPLYNFDCVKKAMKIVMDKEGISLSRKRITLSTSGVVPQIERVGSEIGCLLAISLHATTDEVRNKLVPINKKWNLHQLLESIRNYPTLSNSERVTFEYVMLKGVNDSDADAKRLIKLISGIPAKVNLIPFNSWPEAPFERSDLSRIESFAKIINKAGYSSPVRQPRGEDVMAACGQLKSLSKKTNSNKKNILKTDFLKIPKDVYS